MRCSIIIGLKKYGCVHFEYVLTNYYTLYNNARWFGIFLVKNHLINVYTFLVVKRHLNNFTTHGC